MTRTVRIVGPAVLVLAAFIAVLVALVVGGAAAPAKLADPGSAVRFGLPIARTIVDLSAAVTIGGLALTTIGLSRTAPEWNRAIDIAAGGAAIWTVAAAVTTFLTFLSVTDVKITADASFGQSLNIFLTGTDLGVAWIVAVLVAASVTVLCFAIRGRGMVAVTTGIALVGLVPLAEQGHASGTASHDAAVTALGLHITGAALWIGGLVMLVLVHSVVPSGRLGTIVRRYSSIALGCFVLVAVSGVGSAIIRVGDWANLLTPYGVLILVKAGALVLMGVIGAGQRRSVIRTLDAAPARRGAFWRLVVVELAIMGVASGFAAALGRTATPVGQIALSKTSNPTPAELLTDDPLPGAPHAWSWFTAWNIDLFWCMAVVLFAAAYIAGVVRLRRSGTVWPVRRSIAAAVCLIALLEATCGPLHLLDRYLISANVGAHILLGIVVPACAWAAAPVQLIRVAVHPRDDGSTGVREWTDLMVTSPVVRYLSQPFPAFLLMAAIWWVFYDTRALRWSSSDSIGRTVSDVVFLAVGLLAVGALSSFSAAARTPSARGVVIVRSIGGVVIAAGLVSLGIAFRGPLGLVDASWFGAMGRTWGAGPVSDQAAAGIILIAAGFVVLAVVLLSFLRRRRGASETVTTPPEGDAG